jgi:hypothetical protein
MKAGLTIASAGLLLQLWASASARADTRALGSPARDEESGGRVTARSDTYLRLFRQALLPGPNGTVVDTRTQAPLHEYWALRGDDIVPPWRRGELGAQVSLWAAVTFGQEPGRRLDGDVTSAFIEQRMRRAYLRVGRQGVSVGVARYARFDGLSAGARLDVPLGFDAYAGWTVLPRWDARRGYRHLGSARDELVRDASLLDSPGRAGSWLGGGRIHYDDGSVALGASFHDQREYGELARRDVGLDLRLALDPAWTLAGSTVVDTDGWQIADARLWLDFEPADDLLGSLELRRAQPALFLSRQSVVAVFGAAAYDELGADLDYRPLRHLGLSAGAYVQQSEGEPGVRTELKLRATLDEAERARVQLAHSRLLGADNGYQQLRAALAYQLTRTLSSSVDAYLYWYDEAILGSRHSLVESATARWQAASRWDVLWGVSHVQSPYARSDLQTLVRVGYEIDVR